MNVALMNVVLLANILGITSFAQGAIDISGFSQLLFLFLALAGVALAIAVSLIVIKVVLDLIGIDILGLARTVFGKKG